MSDDEKWTHHYRWRDNMDTWRVDIDRRVSANALAIATDVVHRDNVEKRLGGIEDTLKWLVRLIIGALIMALLAYILKGGLIIG